MRMRKYPIGLQSFRKIRQGDYVYVDKTEIIHRMVTTGNYYFLSRPRRFGKSLLVDTIEELFKGSGELFEGLWIENNWDWSKTNPVIHFNFAELPYKEIGLADALKVELLRNAEKAGVTLQSATLQGLFRELIEKVADAGPVVILIDEYDKPIIDYLNNPTQVEHNRSVLKEFYSVLKGQDQHIRFLLLTGVSRFSKVSIFSDLNHLRDITMNGQFDDLVGFTQQELERDFAMEITELQEQDTDILTKIKDWYNGYSWGAVKWVYNPFSILNYMANHEFRNYWFQTGTPSLFADIIQTNPKTEFPSGKVEMGPEGLMDLFAMRTVYGGPSTINPATIMFQTGYLTVKDYDPQTRMYTLDFPNVKVRESIQVFLLGTYSNEKAMGTYDL